MGRIHILILGLKRLRPYTSSVSVKSSSKFKSCFFRKKGKRLPSAGRSGGGDKSGKGLRHFSMKVCEKVQQKRTTSYNEVSPRMSYLKQC